MFVAGYAIATCTPLNCDTDCADLDGVTAYFLKN